MNIEFGHCYKDAVGRVFGPMFWIDGGWTDGAWPEAGGVLVEKVSKFAVGDRVRCTDHEVENVTGTVAHDDGHVVAVLFDKKHSYGNNLFGFEGLKAVSGYGRYFGYNDVTLIHDEPAPTAFKVGDRVKDRDSDDTATVTAVNDDGTINVRWDVGIRAYGLWPASGFDLVPPEQEQAAALIPRSPHIVARLDGEGRPLPARRPYVHESKVSAVREAERLSRLNPSVEFGTYALVAVSVTPEAITTTRSV